jgi:hypothetical protein
MSVSDSFLLLERIDKVLPFANDWGQGFLTKVKSLVEKDQRLSPAQSIALEKNLKEVENTNKYRKATNQFDNSDPGKARGCTTCKKSGLVSLGGFSFHCHCPKGELVGRNSPELLDKLPTEIHRIVALHNGIISRIFTRLEMVEGVRCFHTLALVCKTKIPEGYPRVGRPQVTYTNYSKETAMKRLTAMVLKYHEDPNYYHCRSVDDPSEHDGSII